MVRERACDARARKFVTFHQNEKDHAPLAARSRKAVLDEEYINVLNRQTHQVEANANLSIMDMEDPMCLVNRDDEYHRGADRDFLFDLSRFEQQAKLDDTEMAAIYTNEIDGHFDDVLADKSKKAVNSKIAPLHSEKVAMADMNRNAKVSGDRVNLGNNSNSRDGNTNVLHANCGKIAERKYSLRSRNHEATGSSSALKGKHAIQKEPGELEEQANRIAGISSGKEPTSTRKRGRPVKAKPDLPRKESTSKRKRGRPAKTKPDTVPSDAVMRFLAKVERQYYLELPISLPSTPGPSYQEGPGKIIYVKDPVGRIWPLLYRDDVFSVNWRILCERNRIKPGEECRFEAENNRNCVYRVDVIRRLGC